MHPEIARRQAEDLVLERILREMSKETGACALKGYQCTKVSELTYWTYCKRCKAEYLLGVLFSEKKAQDVDVLVK